MKQVIVHERREQIVTGSHCMGVPGQVKIDVFHGNYLGMPATRASALHAEHRTQRRLSQGESRTMSEPGKPHGKSDRRRRFSLTQRRRIDRRDEDVMSCRCSVETGQNLRRDLGLIPSITGQFFGADPQSGPDIENGARGHGLGDFQIGQVALTLTWTQSYGAGVYHCSPRYEREKRTEMSWCRKPMRWVAVTGMGGTL